jgi:hypothetical protein
MQITDDQIFARCEITLHRGPEVSRYFLVHLFLHLVELSVAVVNHVSSASHSFLGGEFPVVHEERNQAFELAMHLETESNNI